MIHLLYMDDKNCTFDKFINNNPKRKKKFDKEYNEFLLSEFVLEKMELECISFEKWHDDLRTRKEIKK